mmetsp:Transcript_9006/g.23916  ORF Transcript_9006/g.23916 Transcript_9006/m.23916 type:complete len:232 (-) Transcript_9006:623-1318(-)
MPGAARPPRRWRRPRSAGARRSAAPCSRSRRPPWGTSSRSRAGGRRPPRRPSCAPWSRSSCRPRCAPGGGCTSGRGSGACPATPARPRRRRTRRRPRMAQAPRAPLGSTCPRYPPAAPPRARAPCRAAARSPRSRPPRPRTTRRRPCCPPGTGAWMPSSPCAATSARASSRAPARRQEPGPWCGASRTPCACRPGWTCCPRAGQSAASEPWPRGTAPGLRRSRSTPGRRSA